MKLVKFLPVGVAALFCALAILCVVLRIATAKGRRQPPPEVKPVVLAGVEYRVPNKVESEAIVEAWDTGSKALRWRMKVYTTFKLPHFLLETDVQLNFITNMIAGPAPDELTVANEKGRRYILNTVSRTVRRK
jgi:hypothetical protein